MKLRKKIIGIPVGAVVLAAAASLAATQPARAANPDGSFQLMAATGKCVEVIPDANGNFYIAGNRIQQRTCDGSPQQQWFLQQLSGAFQGVGHVPRYHIVNRMTLQCLDDMNGATNNRNPVQQWTCNSTSSSMVWAVFGPQTLGDRSTTSGRASASTSPTGRCKTVRDCRSTTASTMKEPSPSTTE